MSAEPLYRLVVPVRLESVANKREHWAAKSRRTKVHRSTAYWLLRALAAKPPGGRHAVLIVRVAPRQLDDDNLRSAAKALRDGVADWWGCDDRDPRIEWRYAQERGRPKEYAVRLEISALE